MRDEELHTWGTIQNSIYFEQRHLQGFSTCAMVEQTAKPHQRQSHCEDSSNFDQNICQQNLQKRQPQCSQHIVHVPQQSETNCTHETEARAPEGLLLEYAFVTYLLQSYSQLHEASI